MAMVSVKSQNTMEERDNLVREVLCLAQGFDGKFIAFHPVEPFQCILLGEFSRLEPQTAALLKRLATLGNHYRMLNSFSEQFRNDTTDFVRQAFGRALSEQLDEHRKLVTDLHRQQWSGLFALHAILMDQPLAIFQHLQLICRKIEHKKGVEFLNVLHEVSAHGNEVIQRKSETIFMSTLQPFLAFIRDWLLQKSKITQFNEAESFKYRLPLSENSETSFLPDFLANKSQRMIIKLGVLLKTFKSIMGKDEIKWLERQLDLLCSEAQQNGCPCKVRFNLVLKNKLQVIYEEMNAYIKLELTQRQILQKTMSQVDLFFLSLYNCIEQISRRLEPNQEKAFISLLVANHESSWDQIKEKLSKLDRIVNHTALFPPNNNSSSFLPINFPDDFISTALIDGNCRIIYLDIFIMFYVFMSSKKALLDHWKCIRNFCTEVRSKWPDETPLELASTLFKISHKLNEILWNMWLKEEQMHSEVILQIECFRKQISTPTDAIKLIHVHRRFLDTIHEKVNQCFKVELQTIQELTPEFCKQISAFVELTKKAFFHGNAAGWHHNSERNLRQYREQLEKLGIIEFIDSISIIK